MTFDTINDAQTVAGSGEGTLLANRYRVVRQLGQGGMGSVWLAEDTQLDNKPFAIKILPSILVSNKRAYRQLKDEALVAMKLTHPNIVTLRAFEENNGNPFLVMDYIDGQTLDDYLAEKGKLSEDAVIRVLRPIAAALDYAHSEGVVHRDVKPANVMIRKDGHPYILDFGIAREIQETMTRVTGKLSSGTLLYMSPEQLMGDPPKPAQDVYSFAAMVYECLKGEPPFVRGAIEDQIKNKRPNPLPTEILTGKAAILAAGAMAGLAKKTQDRPPTCAAVLEGSGDPAASPNPQQPGDSRSRAPTVAVTIFVVTLLVAVAGGAWWMIAGRTRHFHVRETTDTREGDAVPVRKRVAGPSVAVTNAVHVPPKSGPAQKEGPERPQGGADGQGGVDTPSPPVETPEEKGRRAYELYRKGEGRKILETFSDYDAEMVPEIAYLKGVVYRDGLSGVKKDLPKTAQMFTLAANRGHAQAQLDLAVMYAEGIGVSRDLDKFLHWTEKAAEQGVVDAALNIGCLYFSGGGGGRIKVDYGKALKYLKLAVDGGRFSACAYLGAMYQKGYGVNVDNMEALKWFKLGAENGDARSENNLGYMYLKGFGTVKDTAKAVDCFQKADAHGNKGAAMSLGLMYENGDGVPQDLHEARRLYLRAKEHKVEGAEKALQRVDGKLKKDAGQGTRPNAVPSDKSRAVGIVARKGDNSRSSNVAVDENGKSFYVRSFELTQKLPIIRKNTYAKAESGYLVSAGQLLSLCREADFSDLKIGEIESCSTGEYLIVTMNNLQLVKIAWQGMDKSPTEESRQKLRTQVELVWEALRAHPKSTDIFVAVQPGVVDMVPRWGRRFSSSKTPKPQPITIRHAK